MDDPWDDKQLRRRRSILALNKAVQRGGNSFFEWLMEKGCRVDVPDSRIRCLPLHFASYNGSHSMVEPKVERLLPHQDGDHCHDCETDNGETALHLAAERGHIQVCQLLLQHGAHAGILNLKQENAQQIALKNGHAECARLLSEHGGNVNEVIDRCDVPYHKRLQLGVQFTTGKDGMTPLMIAAKEGRTDYVRYLLDAGVDANLNGCSYELMPIHRAIIHGHIDCVKALLPPTSQKALLSACYRATDPHWVPDSLDHGGRFENELCDRGESVLHLAVRHDRFEILEYLLINDVNTNHYVKVMDPDIFDGADNMGLWYETALGLACHKGSVEFVNILLDYGARFVFGNESICNPLHRALKSDYSPEFIRFLVRRGADINSHDGIPVALRFALAHPDLLRELLALGGRFENWDLVAHEGVGSVLAKMASDPSGGDALLKVLSVLMHFICRRQFRELFATLKFICDDNPNGLLVGWTDLEQELASPENLQQLCRRKTRDILMMRKGFCLELGILALNLPHICTDYLLFR